MTTSSGILESYLTDNATVAHEQLLWIQERADELLHHNKTQRGSDFMPSLTFYLNTIQDSSGSMIAYEHKRPHMGEAETSQLLWDLQMTNLLLCAQLEYDYRHQKTEDAEKYQGLSERCTELSRLLTEGPLPAGALEESDRSSQKSQSRALHTKDLLAIVCAVNDKRLYWVWGGGFVKLLLDQSLAPDWFHYDASDTAKFPDPYTGCMSWSLYFFRLSVNAGLFFKHFLMPSAAEKDLSWQERTHWRRRKYAILNDLFWAPVNSICFLYKDWQLGQSGYLSQVSGGDVLTTILLVFDTAMALLEYSEEKKIHENELNQFDEDIRLLTTALGSATEATKVFYQHRLANAQKARSLCLHQWELQKKSLVINVLYAMGLLVAFALVAFGGPCSGLVLAGTILCFAFTVLNNATKNGMQIYKTHSSLTENTKRYDEKMTLFVRNNREVSELTEQQKKLLFLEIQELKAETDYQKAIISFQKKQCMLSLLLESVLVPVMIFLPLGPIVYPVILVAAGIMHAIIHACFKAEKAQSSPFEQEEFNAFCQSAESLPLKPSASSRSLAFFNPNTPRKVGPEEARNQSLSLGTET